ncbi:MAG TPA: polysaccharide deacetylase family protein, partial [Candidatus Atribacteria bacterium]|nr:polysaccharide deacetylase family protein [Candidatus Atribacteria bacterium]
MTSFLTIDVEDWFQVENMKGVIAYNQWESYKIRVVDNIKKILDVLASFNIKATFFVLGWLAEKYPGLVREIHERGHEVASHGYA